ncbi:MAG: hypothetical protein HY270_01095, partial [Deltaproteobacteria bacterium]|nr:hypothetical protein [Deltaproteobacteria bacterium]
MKQPGGGDPAWRRELRRGLESGDRQALARVPKTDLHCHGLLSAPLATYESLLGYPLPLPPVRFGSFQRFADYIAANLLATMSGPDSVRAIVRAALQRMAGDGIVYAEMSFDLLVPEFIGIQIEAFGELLAEELSRVAGRLTVAPEIGIARGLPASEAERRLRRWLASGVGRSV